VLGIQTRGKGTCENFWCLGPLLTVLAVEHLDAFAERTLPNFVLYLHPGLAREEGLEPTHFWIGRHRLYEL
jgi:hypothetical protein